MSRSHTLEDLEESVRHAGRKLSADLARTAQDAQEALAETGQALRSAARHTARRVSEGAEDAVEGVTHEVRRHPVAYLGAAAGAGVLIGLLLARRR